MIVRYALQALPKTIFLAGPTPRSSDVQSWRPEALALLEKMAFDGEVMVPESEDWGPHDSYNDQIKWEWAALDRASTVVFWVPRHIETMPAFTTNVEFGMLAASGKAVFGAPSDAPKTSYLRALAYRHNVPVADSLYATLAIAIAHSSRWA